MHITEQANYNECVGNKTSQSNNSVCCDLSAKDEGKSTEIERNSPIMVCSCNIFEKKGIPCRHMFCVMKHKYIKKISKSLYVEKWLKPAITVCSIKLLETNVPRDAMGNDQVCCFEC